MHAGQCHSKCILSKSDVVSKLLDIRVEDKKKPKTKEPKKKNHRTETKYFIYVGLVDWMFEKAAGLKQVTCLRIEDLRHPTLPLC